MKKTMKEQRVKRQRKIKKSNSVAKQNLVKGHSLMAYAKKSKFRVIWKF